MKLPFEEAGQPGAPYQLLLIDELMWLTPHGPFQEQWPLFQGVLDRLAGDRDLRQRVGVLATSIIGTQEINSRFSSTIYIPQDFPLRCNNNWRENRGWIAWCKNIVGGTLFIKRSGQDYRLFRAPFLSMLGPSVPDLFWES